MSQVKIKDDQKHYCLKIDWCSLTFKFTSKNVEKRA